ncbi:MAG: AsmA-like C-terminal region-containing protein [Rhodomicrobiaceae bacterium]
MKRLIGAFLAVIALMVLAVFLAPYFIPQSVLERQLGPALARSTGLQLQEAKRLRLVLFPGPGFAVEEITATLPLDMAAPPVLRSERVMATLRPASLLSGNVELEKLTFKEPLLEIGSAALRTGSNSPARRSVSKASAAVFGAKDSPALIRIANGGGHPPSLPPVEIGIINGSVLLIGREDRRTVLISHADLTVATPGGVQPVTLEGGFRLLDDPVELNATATPLQDAVEIQIASTSPAGNTAIDGTLALQGEPNFSGALRIAIRSGEALLRLSGGSGRFLSRLDGSELSGPFRVSGRQVELDGATLTAPGATGKLDLIADYRGQTRANLRDLVMYGGQGQGVMTVSRGESGAVVGATFSMSNVDARALGQDASGFDWLSGRADARIELAAGGDTADNLLATMKGTAKLAVSDGALEGFDLPQLMAEAQEGEFGKWRREENKRTPFDRMEANYAVVDGVARTDDLTVTGPNIEITGKGQTNFVKERVDYRLNTKLRAPERPAAEGEDQSEDEEDGVLTLPLVVKGDWERPDVYPDIENALKDTDSLHGTAKLFGKSVEKLTGGEVKADDFGRMIDGLFGKKKKKKERDQEPEDEQ